MRVKIKDFIVKITENDIPLEQLINSKYKVIATNINIVKQSIDARDKNNILFVYTIICDMDDINLKKYKNIELYKINEIKMTYPKWNKKYRPIIVGFGPAGMFSALYLSRCNAKPIIIERGNKIDERIKDVEKFIKDKILNESSNIQFGEGGAGTFSDGKLTTNLKDPLINFIISEFVSHGALPEIKYEQMPHIGTDYLTKVVKNIREEIIKNEGEFFFNTEFIDFKDEKDHIKVYTNKGEIFETKHLLLGFGHSARDTIKMLYKNGCNMEPKSFSMGVRIEHKREEINKAQFGKYHNLMPAASYKLACHLTNRSVYTFCMCPGGEVMASQSEKNTILTNGMSYRQRNKENSNSALLVNIDPKDYIKDSILDGLDFQQTYERKAFEISNDYKAPGNLVKEFLNNEIALEKRSVNPSYPHGIIFTDLYNCLPDYVVDSLKEAIPLFDKKIKGFANPDAVLTGVETRSSSPIRMLRDELRQSNIKMIYPIGEGAGYAGGITSAALDGLKTAIMISKE